MEDITLKRQEIGKAATTSQDLAHQPARSVWVSASAGTGKTYVLTRRILHLLVSGGVRHAGEVLALTFTKAAAAEMQNRLRQALMVWATLPADKLADELTTLTGQTPDAATLARARGLFVEVLDTPGGLNISTIHSFCQGLLTRFPLEAHIAPGFTLLEDRAQTEAQAEALNRTIEATLDGDTDLPDWCFALLAETLADTKLRDKFKSFLAARTRMERLLASHGGVEGYLTHLAAALELEGRPTPDTAAAVIAAAAAPDPDRDAVLRAAMLALGQGGKQACQKADALAAFLAAPAADRCRLWPSYERIFLTDKKEIRKQLADKPAASVYGGNLDHDLFAEAERVQSVRYHLSAIRAFLLTEAYLRLGIKVVETYENLKNTRCALDFDDLIARTRDLLTTDAGQAAWVRYKMDTRITHILLDEAQDTDNDQWQILRALMADFYSGEGAIATPRTYFAVGDMKQSIYRFRGAQPTVFANMLAHLEHAEKAGHEMKKVILDTSFRSGEAVLSLVDTVFAHPDRRQAVDAMLNEPLRHRAFQVGAGGRVEVWQAVAEEDEDKKRKEKPQPWQLPARRPREATRLIRHYDRVADTVLGLLNSREPLGTTGRPPALGDIMILLRGRTHMGVLIAALDARGIRHTGADEVTLADEPVVADLLALGRFLANSQDDLSLAHTLRSPLFGLTDPQLHALHQRRVAGGSLWSVLHACTDAPYAQAAQTLTYLLEQADMTTPHGLYVAALVATGGRARFVARYGDASHPASWASVGEMVDVFLDQTLAYTRGHVPSLTGFLHWFETGELTVKRHSASADAVRIMTAHSAKGLQAPVVILPDAATLFYDKIAKDTLVWGKADDGLTDSLFVYGTSATESPPLVTALREEEKKATFRDEMRLLYVALTRAQDRLIIGGTIKGNSKTLSPDTWLAHILDAIRAHPDWREEGETHILDHPVRVPPKPVADAREDLPPMVEPAWVRCPASPEALPATPPPTADDTDRVADLLSRTAADPYRRGVLVHRMLEVLPTYPAAERAPRARRFLAAAAPDWDAATHSKLVDDVMQVFIDHPALFDGAARAEVELVVTAEDGTPQTLRADLLAVRPEGVLIVDYKTNAKVPATVPAAYIRQLAGYRRAAERLWPGRPVRTALLWTAATPPRLQWVDTLAIFQ